MEVTGRWRAPACSALSAATVLGFWIFCAYSVAEGVSKQSVYTGPVGYWLGAYLVFLLGASLACVGLLAWMLLTNDKAWKRCSMQLLAAWALVVGSYAAWHGYALGQYARQAEAAGPAGSFPKQRQLA